MAIGLFATAEVTQMSVNEVIKYREDVAKFIKDCINGDVNIQTDEKAKADDHSEYDPSLRWYSFSVWAEEAKFSAFMVGYLMALGFDENGERHGR